MTTGPATYVALLRGVNVGGGSRVEMPRLRAICAALDFADVATYINSGNVIFRDTRSPGKLVSLLEAGIAEEFGLSVPVLIRDLPAIQGLCGAIPAGWTNDSEQKTDVLFLQDEVDRPDVLDAIAVDPERENVLRLPGALVWNVARANAGRSNALKLMGSDLYRKLTIRNVNTVRRLRELMEAAG
jgi:uncharacterized protein (DUF1697 family)